MAAEAVGGDNRQKNVGWENEASLGGSGKPQPGALPKPDKERKIGHRRIDEAGQVTYKKKTTSELMVAIQLGIGQSVGRLAPKARRDVLYSDFHMVETVFYPRDGGTLTPAHHCSDFSFKAYAPVAFQYFRELFGIQSADYMLSLCNEPLRELSNPGASGSIFYITDDDEFIIKTVQFKEAEFLQKLLPGYYMNLNQNRATLLPKFYGLYCYQCGGKNIRFVVMNNLLPSTVPLHAKYDLKGSTHKRRAANHERTKSSPTFKDLDFVELNPEGIHLDVETHEALRKTIERDCRVLQSFKIMDYSMLLGIHNIDQAARDKMSSAAAAAAATAAAAAAASTESADGDQLKSIVRTKSIRHRVAQFSTALESIQVHTDSFDFVDGNTDIPPGGIPAKNSRGEQLLLYLGIIDILQSYRFTKKLEHTLKAMVSDGDTISVHRPGFYAQRFQDFLANSVFRKLPSPLRHSPSKRKSVIDRQKSLLDATNLSVTSTSPTTTVPPDLELGAVGQQPDVLPVPATNSLQLTLNVGQSNPPVVSQQAQREDGPQSPVADAVESVDSNFVAGVPVSKESDVKMIDHTRNVVSLHQLNTAALAVSSSSGISTRHSVSNVSSSGYLASESGEVAAEKTSSVNQRSAATEQLKQAA